MNDERPPSRIIDLGPSRKEIELEISAEDVRKEYEKTLGEYAGRVKIPGFRKGHASRDMVKSLFDHEILHDVYDSLIPRVLREELKAHDLNPVNVPEIRNLKHERDQPLRCTVTIEVLPDFELPDFRSIPVPRREVTVDDAEVDKALEDIRTKAAEYVPVEGRGVADGDYVAAEIQGRDLSTKRFLPVEKAVVLAGAADNEPALNEAVKGLLPGQERRFNVSYSKDHAQKRLAGKDIEYTAKINEIKAKKLPALNDDFAKSLGDFADLNELKDKLRTEIHESKEKAGRNAVASEILSEMAKRVSLELPPSLVEEEALAILRRLLSASRRPAIPPAALEELKTEAQRQAVERLTNRLILEKIAGKEKLGVSDEEIKGEIKLLAQANHVSPAALADMITREGRGDEIRETLLFRKTVDFLAKNAIIN